MNQTNGDNTGTQQSSGTSTPVEEYNIPQIVLDKYPELVEKIKKTESMSKDEREYWFQILPIMTAEQIDRLNNILEEEAQQLAALDKEYQSELSQLNDKHMQEWDAFEKTQKREERLAAERAHEEKEQDEEAAILEQLDEL